MTANYECSRSNRENIPLPFQSKLSKKRQSFCCSFFPFLVSTLNFQCSEGKTSLIVQVFLKYLLRKMCFFKCITGLVSESPLVVKVLTSPKNSRNLQKSTFILLFHHFQEHWVKKKLFLIRSVILGQLDNKYTGKYECSRSNRESLPLPI